MLELREDDKVSEHEIQRRELPQPDGLEAFRVRLV